MNFVDSARAAVEGLDSVPAVAAESECSGPWHSAGRLSASSADKQQCRRSDSSTSSHCNVACSILECCTWVLASHSSLQRLNLDCLPVVSCCKLASSTVVTSDLDKVKIFKFIIKKATKKVSKQQTW